MQEEAVEDAAPVVDHEGIVSVFMWTAVDGGQFLWKLLSSDN